MGLILASAQLPQCILDIVQCSVEGGASSTVDQCPDQAVALGLASSGGRRRGLCCPMAGRLAQGWAGRSGGFRPSRWWFWRRLADRGRPVVRRVGGCRRRGFVLGLAGGPLRGRSTGHAVGDREVFTPIEPRCGRPRPRIAPESGPHTDLRPRCGQLWPLAAGWLPRWLSTCRRGSRCAACRRHRLASRSIARPARPGWPPCSSVHRWSPSGWPPLLDVRWVSASATWIARVHTRVVSVAVKAVMSAWAALTVAALA